MNAPTTPSKTFSDIVSQLPNIGRNQHAQAILDHAAANLVDVRNNIKDLPPLTGEKKRSAIIISAGPSVYRKNSIQRILNSGYKGTIVSADGAYIGCLKAGLIPDFVLTLDPHESRIVRWFGDPEFEKHSAQDDYFQRQDLDVDFRKNSIEQNKKHIELVNQHGHKTKAIVASSAPRNVVARLKEARFDMYWWNPLVDDPHQPDSLTRKIYNINGLTCFNTGGTVGTASWVFADSILKIPKIALVGMDFGYYMDTPKNKTQTYYELVNHLGNEKDVEVCFQEFEFPLTKEKFYVDPTYFGYRNNFLALSKRGKSKTINCTEAGILFDDHIQCQTLDEFVGEMQKTGV